MQEEENIQKWGSTGGGSTGVVVGGSDKCKPPSVTGGFWKCEVKEVRVPVSNQEKRHKRDAAEGRWSKPTPTVPTIGVLRTICHLSCETTRYKLVGHSQAVCDPRTGKWIKPASAYCEALNLKPKPPKTCSDLRATNGVFKCTGSASARQCTLQCSHGSKSTNGRYHFNCHYGHWDGRADCTAASKCQVPQRKAHDKGYWHCQPGPCQPVTSSYGRKKRSDDDGEDLGRWGAPAPRCLICHFKCDPIHKLKGGGKAQCRMSDGVWIEKSMPVCHMGHMCEWPTAGPMGCYECKDNLMQLGYQGLGFNTESEDDEDRREINFEDFEEVEEDDEDYDSFFRKKRDADKKADKKARKAAKQNQSDGIARWSPPPPPTYPPPTWWNAYWECKIHCAKYHYPRSNGYVAKCKLDSSTWLVPPTECVYRTPCKDPTTSHGSFQCWETTILPEKDDEGPPEEEEKDDDKKPPSKDDGSKKKKKKGKGRRSASNSTEPASADEYLYRGDEVDEYFSPNPIGRWGPPSKPPKPDQRYWEFDVRKECVLTCNDCYDPTNKKSICINGEWQEGYKPGKCDSWEKCAEKPWWPIGNGYWSCTGGAGRVRTCGLQCYDHHIVQPIIPRLPQPEDPHKVGCDNKYVTIENGWMECHTNNSPVDCMIMCNKGYTPNSSQAMATCSNGDFLPAQSGSNSWACVPGECDKGQWGEVCWTKASMGRKKRAIEADEITARTRREDNEEEAGLGRWGMAVSPTARCDNCNGMWKNQIHCVFDTKCTDVPPHVPGGSARCERVMEGKQDYHRCEVQCPKNHVAVCNSAAGRKRREDEDIGRWGQTPVTTAATVTKLPQTQQIMTCDAKSGTWNQRCTCEWNLECAVPQRPNANYECNWVNGIFVCQLQCKGKGEYVPAKWIDVWEFRCKRGVWIEKTPQGCVYEPPCVKPDVENGKLKNCRRETCQAPEDVVMELMPGQANHNYINEDVITGGHIGYMGRKRREDSYEEEETVDAEFTADGKFYNDDGSYTEFTYDSNGLPVTQAADDTEQVVTDDDDMEQGALASEGSIGRWSFNHFGRCPVRRSIGGGQLHCHSTGGIIGMGHHPVGMPPPMSHHNRCREKNPINGGWMECKPHGGICMIMCNPGMVPITANLFAPCNGRQWNPSQWGCRPGHCAHHIYKEACYDHPNNVHGKKRRSADNDTISYEEGDEDEQRGLFDRWIAPPPPPPPPPAHYVLCSVSCAHNHRHAGAVNYKCDPRDGTFAPSLKGCYNVKPRPPVVKTKQTSCLCCDVKCDEWYQGGGTAKCAKGYWFQVDKCDKYGMCGKPANPANGEYTCLYEHEYGYMSRKRRSDDEPDYDREAPEEDRSESFGWSTAKDFKQYVKNIQDVNDGSSMEVGGYRWEQVKQKKMICNLACAPGYVAVAPQAVCIDGTWVVKPSYCKPQHKCSAPPSNSNGIWECRVEKWPVGTTPGMPGQCREKNPITNGWMECKPHGGMCMIMCNNGYVPLTTNLMSGCNGAQWNPSLWGCKPGYCDNAIYKEACWNHPNNNFGRKRREAETPAPQPIFSKYVKVTDHFDIDDFPEMQDYSSAGTDRWEQMQMKSFLVCKLRCQGGTFQSGSTVAKCDLDTGFWHPSPGQCKPWVGGSKCAAPSADSGTYNCYSVTGSAHGRKRRDTELSEFEDVWQNRPNGGVLGRWGQSYMVCDLTCSPTMVPENGKYVAKCDQTSGKWIAPPTNCIETNYTPKCLQKLVNGGVINCEARERGKTRYDCDLNCYNGFEPIDPNRVSYTCNDKSGAYVPQPLGCKTKVIPPAPTGCVKPTNTANGSWKCHKQDFDQPYPPQSRTLNWDSLPDLPRAKRDADEEGYVDEEIIYDNTNEDEADSNEIGRWASGKKPKNFICQVKCDKGYQMSGNYLAVCRVDSNQWIMPPVAFCNEHPKKPGLCKVPTIKDGSYDCKEVKEKNNNSDISPLFECTLTCKNGYRPGHGRWTATCDQNTGLWQIPPANCIKDVRKCENVPSVQNGFMSCTSQNRNEEFDGAAPKPTGFDPLLGIQFTTHADLAVQSTRATTTRAPVTTRAQTTKASRAEEEEQKTKPANAEDMVGATGECALEPAVNEVKGGGLHCRKDRAGNTLCMIKCDEGFRPWHSNLVILCRNGIYYNRNNPTEVQKNMKCKEAPCDVERFGVACYDHPANRERREAEFEAALNEEPAVAAGRWHQPTPPLKTCQVQCNSGYQNTGSPVAECDLNTGEWRTMPGQCEPVPDNTLGCAAPDDVAYGEWKCWVSNDSDDMRGASNTLPPDGSQQREDGKKKKKKQKQKAQDKGLFEFIPSSGMSKDEFEDYVDRSFGFDAVRRRRSANDAWSDAIGRWGSQYFICQLECDAGYELKDFNYNKVGCRMSDNHWLKPYIQKKHFWLVFK